MNRTDLVDRRDRGSRVACSVRYARRRTHTLIHPIPAIGWLAALLAVVCLQRLAGAIAIDGHFEDWEAIAPATAHPLLSEGTGEPGASADDLDSVWLVSDSEAVYLSLRCTEPIRTGHDWGFFILFDTDRATSTGYRSGPLGVDYAVQVRDDVPGAVWVHRRIDGDNTSAWSRWAGTALTEACAMGPGESANRLELRVPWRLLGVEDPEGAIVRIRVCHNSPFLHLDSGDWVPDSENAYLTLGKDPLAMESAENLCRNGRFENLLEAAATPLPQDWRVYKPAGGAIEMTPEAAEGEHALLLRSSGDDPVGMDSAVMQVRTAQARFQYRCLAAEADGANMAVSVLGLDGPEGNEVARWTYTPPPEHVADGAWHTGTIDVRTPPTGYCRVSIRVNEGTDVHCASTWAFDDVAVYSIPQGAQVSLAATWSNKPLARVGDSIHFSTWVENGGDHPARNLDLTLELPEGLRADQAVQTLSELPSGCYERVDWVLGAEVPLRGAVRVALTWQPEGGAAMSPARTPDYTFLVISAEEELDRQAICTDEKGYWRRIERPATLQVDNEAPVKPVRHLRSAEIGHNLYGICTQVPRARDYETPFDPAHLIDGNPDTVWSSQQRPNAYPGAPPWVEIDLDGEKELRGLNLVPYWRNTDFPIGFRMLARAEGEAWHAVLHVRNHALRRGGEMRGDKFLQSFTLHAPTRARQVRLEFERLPLSGGNYAEVSQGYKARLGGIELIDENGQNVALPERGATCRAGEFFTAWQSTAESIAPAFDRLFDIGLKWVRIGQWGDQTEWAAIEREKGVFKTDPVTDAAIQKLADNGVDILYGLNYGNHHYSDDEVWLDIGPIYREGNPFNWNLGPSTPAQREAFVRYVDFVVHRYRDQVKWWELWNEQNGWFPIHTGVISHQPELYGKLLYDVAKHIKGIDPELKVMYGGTAAPAPVSTEVALREGAAPYLDATAFHPYGAPIPEAGLGTMESASDGTNLGRSREDTGWERLEDVLEGVREPFVKHGRPGIAVWMNEFGTNVEGLDFSYHPGIGEYGCAKHIMRFYLYSAWLDVPTAWWALHNLNRSQDWGIIGIEDYELRPMSYALRNVCSVVSDVEPVHGLDAAFDGEAPNLKIIAFRRTNRDETLVLAWAAEEKNEAVRDYPGELSVACDRTPARVTVTDLYWGVEQQAQWDTDAGRIRVSGLHLRDYPTVVSLQWE